MLSNKYQPSSLSEQENGGLTQNKVTINTKGKMTVHMQIMTRVGAVYAKH